MSGRDERTPAARAHGETARRIGAHRESDICPVCKEPVDTVVRARKVLGAYVPGYAAGPCRNPRCSANPDRTDTAVDTGTGRESGAEGEAGAEREPVARRETEEQADWRPEDPT